MIAPVIGMGDRNMVWLRRLTVLALALTAGSSGAWAAGHKGVDLNNLQNVFTFPPGGFGESFKLKMMVQIAFNPGMSDRKGCRLQVYMINQSKVTINMRAMVTTYISHDSDPVEEGDTDLVPSAVLPPGQMVMRLFSCKPADLVDMPRTNEYSWPNICEINGEVQTPCPVEIDFSSTMRMVVHTPEGGLKAP